MGVFRQISFISRLFRRAKPRAPRVAPADSSELLQIWKSLRVNYFPERTELDDYSIRWSSRPQRRTLASCSFGRRKVIVAKELNYPNHKRWLAPLLYHEMCHAVLGETARSASGRGDWHGSAFKALEKRHPEIPALDHWIKSGGWRSAVLSDRAKSAWAKKRR